MAEDSSIMSQITINRIKIITMYIMSIFYISVGINHFVDPDWFVQIVPLYLSRYDLELVYISGVCEVMFGVLILFKKTRYYAALGLIVTLAAVFPANIYLAQSDGVVMGTSAAIAWYRLPFQSLFIVLAYWHRS